MFQVIQCFFGFLEFLSTEFAACSRPPNRVILRKASNPRTQQQRDGCREIDAFAFSATQLSCQMVHCDFDRLKVGLLYLNIYSKPTFNRSKSFQ